jgi:hypothetical protein
MGLPDRQATITEAGKLRCQDFGNDAGCSSSLQIRVRLTPSIFVDDIGQRDTTDWPEPPHWVADRNQGIGMHAGRQAESGLCCLLDLTN